jgi:two-component system, chemotaxis family, response regulator Rcp1
MLSRKRGEPWQILLAEDNQADVYLIWLALQEQDLQFEFQVIENGEQALASWEEVERAAAPRPDMVLLDLNLPMISGQDLLRRIRSRRDFDDVPVIVLTSSDSQRDRSEALELGADAYIRKPASLEEYAQVAAQIRSHLEPTPA